MFYQECVMNSYFYMYNMNYGHYGVYNKHMMFVLTGSLSMINPSSFKLGPYQWQSSSELQLRSYICCIHLIAIVFIYQTHMRTRTHTSTHTRTRTHTHAHAHTHTHTHTHTQILLNSALCKINPGYSKLS